MLMRSFRRRRNTFVCVTNYTTNAAAITANQFIRKVEKPLFSNGRRCCFSPPMNTIFWFYIIHIIYIFHFSLKLK